MKLKLEEKTKALLLAIGLMAAALIAFYFLLHDHERVEAAVKFTVRAFRPVTFGLIFAYMLSKPLNWIENTVLKKWRPKFKKNVKRGVAVLLVMLITLTLVVSLLAFVLPQLVQSIATLVNNTQNYAESALSFAKDLTGRLGIDWNADFISKFTDNIESYLQNILSYLSGILPQAWSYTAEVISTVLNIFFGIAISVYLLYSKEKLAAQFRKLLYAILPKKPVRELEHIWRLSDDTFGKYIFGRIIDGLIIGIICFIVITILDMPYTVLISVLIGVTNIIPIIGPFMGAIPSALIILMTGEPLKMLIFVIMIIALQQIDGNFIGPRIVGETTGISGLWVMVGVLVGGSFWQLPGVLLSVPLLSVIMKVTKEKAEIRLKKKGLPVDTPKYFKGSEIESDIQNTNYKKEEIMKR